MIFVILLFFVCFTFCIYAIGIKSLSIKSMVEENEREKRRALNFDVYDGENAKICKFHDTKLYHYYDSNNLSLRLSC